MKNNLGLFLTKRAFLSPDREAYVDSHSPLRLTYRALNERANQLAHAILERKFPRQSKFSIIMYNNIEFLEIYHGLTRAAMISVPINFRLVPAELEYVINNSDSVGLFVGIELFDKLQLLLVVCALLVDAMALWAILARISEFGFTPNRTAALGENLILLANLGGAAVLYAKFLLKRAGFVSLERWQTGYLPVYAVWAAIVVVIFPLVFGFQ